MMQKLPIGVQDFTTLQTENFVYVDKTKYLYDLITTNRIYFLSRPRRFGKSLIISTLEAIFQGKKELFKDLWIGQTDYDWKVYPIIRIDMSRVERTSPELFNQTMKGLLLDIAKHYNVDILRKNEPISSLFFQLIEVLSVIQKVVVLIDEYDKPILDNIARIEDAIAMRDLLRDFYGILKAQDGNLKFLLLTGVSKFAKASVFSALNNLQDLTLDNRYASMLGYTQEELETVYAPWIEKLTNASSMSTTDTLSKIKRWYNGYQFSSEGVRVYNPFSTLLLFEQQAYRVYWFETGTPKFLVDLIEKSPYTPEDLNNFEVGETAFGTYDIERLELLPLLYQTGYLTIAHYDAEFCFYTLRFPNLEVEQSFNEVLLTRWSEVDRGLQDRALVGMIKALQKNDFDHFFGCLKSFLASIPYELHQPNEAYYHSIFYLIFHLIGYRINAEVHTNKGRIDAVIELKDKIFIIEFKINQTAEIALKQIYEKGYADRYKNSGKAIYLLGVNFSTEERNIDEWKLETLELTYIKQEFE